MAAVPDPNTQQKYLTNMAAGKTSTGGVANAGQIAWATSQLANQPAVPNPATKPEQKLSPAPPKETTPQGLQPVTPAATVPTPPTTPAPQPAQSPEYTNWLAKQNELFTKLESMTNQQFSYNPETDPAYQAQRQIAQLRAGDANKATVETMNDRGLLQSTMTNSQLDQNNQRAEQEAAAYIPQYRDQAYGQFKDGLQNASNLLTTARGLRGDQFSEGVTEAGLTGTYQSPEVKSQISELLALKQKAEAKGITAADRAALSKQADGIRSQLSAAGVDISKLGANTNSSNASEGAGVKTLAAQGLEMQKAEQEWNHAFAQGQFDFTKAQTIWENAFKDKSFAQSVKDAAASRGLQWASLSQNDQHFIADQAFKQKQLDWSKDEENPDNIYKKSQIDALKNPPPKYNGLSASQVLDNVRSMYTEPSYAPVAYPGASPIKLGDKITTDPAKREQMFLNVIDAHLPSDAETKQILSSLGLTKEEIASFTKKNGG